MTAWLSHLCAALGEPRPVSSLLDDTEGVDAAVVGTLRARGLHQFYVDARSTPELCMAAMRQTLDASGLSPTDIGAIVVGHSTSQWDLEQELHLLRVLSAAGF